MAPPRPDINPAKLLSSQAHQLPGKLLVTELFFSVPLDHRHPDGPTLRIFCRMAEKLEKPISKKPEEKEKQLPILVYLQGGPGFGCSHPKDTPDTPLILERGYKLMSFDHRGMGLSTPITAGTLKKRGSVEEQAAYLEHFRATSAVQDLEAIRICLTKDYPDELKKWSIMGQSYGGFVSVSYLSLYPHGLREVFIFGGLPPVTENTPDRPARRLAQKVRERNEAYYTKYAEDIPKVKRIVEYLRNGDVKLPDGGTLTPGRFLEQGITFGFHGGIDNVHARVLRAYDDLENLGELTRPSISGISMGFDTAVLYAILHQPLYCQKEKSSWAFDRVISELKDFGHEESREQYLFTGEMVFKRAYDDYSELRDLKPVAEILEAKDDWPELYDIDQLRKNEVPTYAAIFTEDMYVGYQPSVETAELIGQCKYLITNQLYHDAIRAKANEILTKIFALRDDVID